MTEAPENRFDAGDRTRHWRDPDKFTELIAQQVEARMKRGRVFLPPTDAIHERR